MQMTVGQLGRASLYMQTFYVRAVESGKQSHDLIELPPDVFVPRLEPEVRAIPMLKDYAGTFLTHKKEITRSGTYSLYDSYLQNGLLPLFGKMPLNSITESRIQDFVNMSFRKGWTASYIRAHVVLLKSILRSAERDGLLKAPSMQIIFPKQTGTEISVLTEEESERLNDYLMQDKKTISAALLIALHTGIKVG